MKIILEANDIKPGAQFDTRTDRILAYTNDAGGISLVSINQAIEINNRGKPLHETLNAMNATPAWLPGVLEKEESRLLAIEELSRPD